jgi:DNA-directed RNA polymerase specialized sigma24 family protein
MGWMTRTRTRRTSASTARDVAPDNAARRFVTTRWSIIEKAGSADAKEALSSLCQAYWYPIYSFIRAQGIGSEDARDVTQGFFASLLQRNDIAKLNPLQGRFRAWLRTCAKHYLLNELDRAGAEKRGGHEVCVSLDVIAAEDRLRLEPCEPMGAEHFFDRQWAKSSTGPW